jgi:molybdopterin synthase sulfur carrier subunit
LINIKVTVRLFATLRKGRFKEQVFDYEEGTTVADVIKQLNIPHKELGIVFLNGKHTELQQTLRDTDILAIFPPVGGG